MAARRYTSPVRDAQRERTRARVLDAALAVLQREGLDQVTIPRVARAARVSIPTVYRHFPTVDDLLRAFHDWIRPRVGQSFERLRSLAPDQLAAMPLDNYPRYEAEATVLVPLMESREFNRVRVAATSGRAAAGAAVLRPIAPGWSQQDLEGAAGAIHCLIPPQAWRWLRETWGLDADTAARAASWAVRVLVDAVARGEGLDAPAAATRPRVRPAARRPPRRAKGARP